MHPALREDDVSSTFPASLAVDQIVEQLWPLAQAVEEAQSKCRLRRVPTWLDMSMAGAVEAWAAGAAWPLVVGSCRD